MFLQQNTPIILLLGPFVDSGDGATPETALSIANSDVLLCKHGYGTLVAKHSSIVSAHISKGFYTVVLDAVDTNTLGQLQIVIQMAGALPYDISFTVLAEGAYEKLTVSTVMDTDYSD